MARAVVLCLAVGMLSVLVLAQSANVSGIWELEMMWPETTSTGSCIFEQQGESLAGSCGGDERFAVRGRVDGNRVSWQFDVAQGGAAGRMEFSGELDGQETTIRGSCTIVGANSGTFRMKKTG